MPRLASTRFLCGAFAAALALAAPSLALAQTNPAAESANDEGKKLFSAGDYQGAAAKFREAQSLSPDARYDFNLCAALEKAGDLDGALTECDRVYQHNPSDDLKAKTGQRAAAIREAKRQRDAATPAPTPENPNPVAPPMQPEPPPAPAPEQPKYSFALGGEIGPSIVLGLKGDVESNISASDVYDLGGTLRLYADYQLVGDSLGLRGLLNFAGNGVTIATQFGDVEGTMSTVMLGVGAYYNLNLGAFTATASAGIGVAYQSAETDDSVIMVETESESSLGFDLALTLKYVIQGQHVLTLTPLALSFYGGDELGYPSSAYAFCIGYAIRFTSNSPLPGLFTLE